MFAQGVAIIAVMAIPASASAAAQYIYWGNNALSGIGRTAADGSGTPQADFVSASTAVAPVYLTVNGNWLYWGRNSGVGRVTLAGTGANNTYVSTGYTTLGGVAADASYLYFTTQQSLGNNTIARLPLSGGAVNSSFIPLSGSEPTGIALSGGNFYWNQSGSNPTKIGTVADTGSGLVDPTWATGASQSRGITSDGTYIYWADDLNQRIGRVAIASPGSPDPTFITGAATSGIKGVAVDDEYLYWVNQVSPGNDKIGRAKLNGASSATNINPSFISLPGEAYGIAVGTPSVSTYALTVAVSGSGSGTVTSAPSGINCGATCTASFASGATVTLTAVPASGSAFAGWQGACTGEATTCSLPMTQARSVTATFTASGSSGGTSAAGGGGGSASGSSTTPSNTFVVRRPAVRGAALSTRVVVPGAGRITQRGTRRATAAGAHAVRRVTACTASRTAARAGTLTITCRLNAATQAARRTGRVSLRVSTTFMPSGGTARTTTRTVILPRLVARPATVVG